MYLILDEWIIHDLQNDNGKDKQKESFKFLEKIKKKCDKIVVVKDSKFIKKIWNFSKIISEKNFDSELRYKFKFLKNCFIKNSQKVEILSNDNIKSNENNEILEDFNIDDHYIVLTYLYLKQNNKQTIIITTDEQLKEKLEKKGLSIKFREDFIMEYFNNQKT